MEIELMIRARLVISYHKLYEITNRVCGSCSPPYNCCTDFSCHLADRWSSRRWNIKIEPTEEFKRGETHVPFLGRCGCIVPPHMRPICTTYFCNDPVSRQGRLRVVGEEYLRHRDDAMEFENVLDVMSGGQFTVVEPFV